ncbi:bifunctional UDP-N-acetylglucosamine pyrophosphorylase/glucosamine-1-phosphate N-acetyltransferase [Candidatus Fervidibacter sacchari]|uniref:Bifunctional UDP-N-acetylglucosamine pyrophosphorylase/glucosamine-1-phosphate N-acetyltransferase n=1 Tax=Candidatus Fervidibacter sacchari TaxID=1448929 RepID=A0ABT2EQN6_9BACT|nr:bifunctional UDP-N-acetylglucosamine pyrophosphorylase/glucosamine-1-phosphate N-acetyltransferase [Candidatus Fervidibacter sacchari]
MKGRLDLRPEKLAVRKAVILAAGLSTRTYPLTVRKPKPLLKLANEPNLCHLIRGLKSAGVKHVILVVGFERQQIEQRLGDNFEGIRIDYALQEQALGTGHAVLQAEPFVKGEPFMVLNGDDLLLPDALRDGASCVPSLIVAWHDQPQRFGVVEVANGYVHRIHEKPKEAPPKALVSTGAWALPPEAMDWLKNLQPAEDGEIRLPDIMPNLVQIGLRAVITEDGWMPVTYPWDVLLATKHLLNLWGTERVNELLPPLQVLGEVDPTAEIIGDVRVEAGAKIGAGAKIIGPSIIGKGSVIGEGCDIVRTVIGENCRIKRGAHLEDCVLLDNVQIGEDAELEWSVIGDNAVIGNEVKAFSKVPTGITVRSVVKGQLVDTGMERLGCIIGDGARIGDRSVLYPGVKIWVDKVVLPRTEVLEDVR